MGDDLERIESALTSLAAEPRPHGCLKLKGVKNEWRIRVGRYRIVYSIKDTELLIWVIKIDQRKDIYRK